MDTPADLDYTPQRREPDKREQYSDNTEKVIRSYGLDQAATNYLIDRHKDAANAPGNREKSDRYEIIFNENPMDYLAAYRKAQVNFEMGRNSTAMKWVNKAIEIKPDYIPALRFKRKVEGRLK